MGYKVWPEMKVDKPEVLPLILKEELEDGTPLSDIFDDEGNPHEWLKWYDREKEMSKLSEKFPDLLITLKIQGEDYEDISIEYYRNGHSEIYGLEIKFPPPTI